MGKPVIWSSVSEQDLREIKTFYDERNQSDLYSNKLLSLFEKGGNLLSAFPNLGRQTDQGHIRFIVIKDYLLFYTNEQDRIVIHTVWDSRQDPEQLSSLLESL
jgi:plasmid stabilization system protein ParE